jgi:pimeloyl-ACP methyl ester carboxylesterase
LRVEEHMITLADLPVFYRSAGPEHSGQSAPVVYVHGAPTSSDDWTGMLGRTGGLAPDLLGFGRTGKGAHLEYTPDALADFLGEFLDAVGVDRLKLVLHGWGAAGGVLLAARQPERVERLALLNPIGLLEGLRWPWWARALRTRALGELMMGFTTRMLLTRTLRRGSASPTAWPRDRVASVWEQFDQGTQRAVLRLTRSVDHERMQTMATALRSLDLPALIVWGDRDPWWRAEVAEAYAALLPQAVVERTPDAGHWPWLDDDSVAELLAGFVEGSTALGSP